MAATTGAAAAVPLGVHRRVHPWEGREPQSPRERELKEFADELDRFLGILQEKHDEIMSLRREQQQGEQRLQQGWEELHREREELQRQRDELRGEWEKLEREKERVGEGRSKPVGAPRTGENLLSVAAVASHHTGEELSDASSVVESDDGSMNDIVAPLSSSEGSGAGARAQHVRVFHFAQGIPSPDVESQGWDPATASLPGTPQSLPPVSALRDFWEYRIARPATEAKSDLVNRVTEMARRAQQELDERISEAMEAACTVEDQELAVRDAEQNFFQSQDLLDGFEHDVSLLQGTLKQMNDELARTVDNLQSLEKSLSDQHQKRHPVFSSPMSSGSGGGSGPEAARVNFRRRAATLRPSDLRALDTSTPISLSKDRNSLLGSQASVFSTAWTNTMSIGRSRAYSQKGSNHIRRLSDPTMLTANAKLEMEREKEKFVRSRTKSFLRTAPGHLSGHLLDAPLISVSDPSPSGPGSRMHRGGHGKPNVDVDLTDVSSHTSLSRRASGSADPPRPPTTSSSTSRPLRSALMSSAEAKNEAAARNIEEIIDLFSKRSKELQGSEKDLHDLRESVRQKKEEFLKRERALEMLEDDIRTRDLASKRLEADIVVRDRELKEKELLVSQLQEELGSLESILQDKEKKLTAQEHELQEREAAVEEKWSTLASDKEAVAIQSETLKRRLTTLEEREMDCDTRLVKVQRREDEIQALEDRYEELLLKVQQREEAVSIREEQVRLAKEDLDCASPAVHSREEEVTKRWQQCQAKEEELHSREARLASQEEDMDKRETRIVSSEKDLQERLRLLQQAESSNREDLRRVEETRKELENLRQKTLARERSLQSRREQLAKREVELMEMNSTLHLRSSLVSERELRVQETERQLRERELAVRAGMSPLRSRTPGSANSGLRTSGSPLRIASAQTTADTEDSRLGSVMARTSSPQLGSLPVLPLFSPQKNSPTLSSSTSVLNHSSTSQNYLHHPGLQTPPNSARGSVSASQNEQVQELERMSSAPVPYEGVSQVNSKQPSSAPVGESATAGPATASEEPAAVEPAPQKENNVDSLLDSDEHHQVANRRTEIAARLGRLARFRQLRSQSKVPGPSA